MISDIDMLRRDEALMLQSFQEFAHLLICSSRRDMSDRVRKDESGFAPSWRQSINHCIRSDVGLRSCNAETPQEDFPTG